MAVLESKTSLTAYPTRAMDKSRARGTALPNLSPIETQVTAYFPGRVRGLQNGKSGREKRRVSPKPYFGNGGTY